MLETLITSKTRIRILVKFFINVANDGYLRGLAEELNESTNSIRKELNNLLQAGYLEKEAINNKVIYKANAKHPLFTVLQKIVHQHIGIDAIVELILQRIGTIEKVVVIGDYANGKDSGIIEVVLIGKELDAKYIYNLASKIESRIKRKIKFYINDYQYGKGLVIYEAT
ncbi:helix-turn-helix domain-containing protein [Flavobacterium luteum]|uniref:ArsR family transcriptional regulator n=1 Tax=Flavobacterium luteum TaxID=2026654 RepID=A0A7J5AE10_9FLAO|nr:ArsR family transcriptional regulator [Flavobacterium luteum]KAB1155802.1 ArsR family transcriptional regulator [Flavobacterium luteum]